MPFGAGFPAAYALNPPLAAAISYIHQHRRRYSRSSSNLVSIAEVRMTAAATWGSCSNGAAAAPTSAPAGPRFYKADDQQQLAAQVSEESSATALVTITTTLDHSGDEGSPRLLAAAADCASASSSPRSVASTAIHFADPAAAPGAAAVGAAAARLGVWRSVLTFMATVQASPLLPSALTSIATTGTYPVADAHTGLRGLRWTLAALLALHLRSGRAATTEDDLLASLWTLESWGDAWRSSASTVLGDYVKHLAVFDEQRARRMAANWREVFVAWRASVVGSQRELLAAVDWNVRLDAAADLLPCYAMLFGEQEGECASGLVAPEGGAVAAIWQLRAAAVAVPPSEAAWAGRMDAYCQRITHQARRIKAAEQAAEEAVHSASESVAPSAKRHRQV